VEALTSKLLPSILPDLDICETPGVTPRDLCLCLGWWEPRMERVVAPPARGGHRMLLYNILHVTFQVFVSVCTIGSEAFLCCTIVGRRTSSKRSCPVVSPLRLMSQSVDGIVGIGDFDRSHFVAVVVCRSGYCCKSGYCRKSGFYF
jgi:hypothetical protein